MLAIVDTKTGNILDSGTASLVRLVCGKRIVTNFHVWHGFTDYQDANPSIALELLGGVKDGQSVDISNSQVVAKDRTLDVAVLDFPSETIEAMNKEYYDVVENPPTRVVEGDAGVVVGFSGKAMRIIDGKVLQFANACGGIVQWVSPIKFGIELNRTIIEVLDDDRAVVNWGGFSGSFVYGGKRDSTLYPCGILHHCSGDGTDAENFDLHATYLDVIQPDGTLRI